MSSSTLKVEVAEAFLPLLQPKRYKAAYGGRGGAKSHFFAEQLISRAYGKKTRAVCIREVQNSLRESVRQLLVDKIAKFGLGAHFEVLESEIRCKRNGGLIIFKGMQAYNAENIKSLEDFDIAWVEEAQTFSETSLRLLRPTIRNEGSEIWFSWNPRHDDDPVDAFFRKVARDDAIVAPVNWEGNPWFPEVLRQEKDADYRADREMAAHVWGGGYLLISEASYYGRLLAQAENEGRIGDFPHNPALPVKTAWDIGVDDYTSVWFIQDDGVLPTVLDYYEASGFYAEDIIRDALPELHPDKAAGFLKRKEIGREHPFTYAEHFLPHDVKNREWGAGRTRPLTLMRLGVKPVHVGAALGPVERINATRQILPIARFNRTPRVTLGISRLRRYSRKRNETMNTYLGPLHDENSHGADAFGEYAVNCHFVPIVEKPKAKPQPLGTVVLGPPEPRSQKRIAT